MLVVIRVSAQINGDRKQVGPQQGSLGKVIEAFCMSV